MSEKTISLASLLVAILAVFASLLVPEIRENFFGLDKKEKIETNKDLEIETNDKKDKNSTNIENKNQLNCFKYLPFIEDSVIYLQVIINKQVQNQYSYLVEDFLQAKSDFTGRFKIIDNIQYEKKRGHMVLYDISTKKMETREILNEKNNNTNSLITTSLIGKISLLNIENRNSMVQCPIDVRLAGNKGMNILPSGIKKSLKGI